MKLFQVLPEKLIRELSMELLQELPAELLQKLSEKLIHELPEEIGGNSRKSYKIHRKGPYGRTSRGTPTTQFNTDVGQLKGDGSSCRVLAKQ